MKSDRNITLYECLEALGLVLEYDLNDNPTHQHAVRVGEGCVVIADRIGLDRKKIQQMYFAGLLHDIGKIAIDINILKKNGKLTDREFEIVRRHPLIGSRIAAALPELTDLAFLIRWHHEKWDGTGYPDKISHNQIPVEAQILSVIDCFDSMQTPRFDRDKLSLDESYSIIKKEREKSFNPEIVDIICESIEKNEITPGIPSQKFIDLKNVHLKSPLDDIQDDYWASIGMSGLYPILRLFAKVIDAKHCYTHGHSTRVSILSKYIAEVAGFPIQDILKVEVAGLLHDAGKISIPHELLNKKNSPNSDEWLTIKCHPVHSFKILNNISVIKDIAAITQQHHERLDGSGYPSGQSGSSINILSQIIAICDAFDAMTSERTYREKTSYENAYSELAKGSGTLFNRELVKLLINIPPLYIKTLFDMHIGQ